LKININHISIAAIVTLLAASIVLLARVCSREKENNAKANLSYLIKLGDRAMQAKETDSALFYYGQIVNAYDSALPANDKKLCAKALNNSGYIYFFTLNDYPNAYRCFLEAKEIAEETGAMSTLCRCYLNIGNIYGAYDIEKMTIEMYRKAFHLALDQKDWPIVVTSFINLAGGYMQSPEKCPEGIEDVRQAFEACALPDTVANALFAREQCNALKALTKNDYVGAAVHINQGKEILPDGMGNARIALAQDLLCALVTERSGDTATAGIMFGEILRQAEPTREADIQRVCLQALARLSEATGNTQSSRDFMLRQYSIQDSLLDIRRFAEIKDLAGIYERRGITRDLNQLKEKKHYQDIVLYILAGVAALTAALLAWVWHKNRQLQLRNAELFRRYREMQKLKAEADKALVGTVLKTQKETGQKSSSPSMELDEDFMRNLYAKIVEVMNSEAIYSPAFSLDTLAMLTDAKTRYVSHVLSSIGGKNFAGMLAEYRVREASRRIADKDSYGHMTLEAIGAEVGFRNRSTFSVTFKKVTGLSPKEYQRTAECEKNID